MQAVFLLQASTALVDVAELPDVFSEDDDARIALECMIEALVDDLEATQLRSIAGNRCGHFHDVHGRVLAAGVQVTVVHGIAGALCLTPPGDDVGGQLATMRDHGAGERAQDVAPEGRLVALQLRLRFRRTQTVE